MAALMLHAGIFHYHKAAPKMEWFQDIESMLNHHIAGLVGLGSLAWAGHCIHIGAPTAALLDAIDAGSPLVINGKEIAQNLRDELKQEIDRLKSKTGKVPGLAVVI